MNVAWKLIKTWLPLIEEKQSVWWKVNSSKISNTLSQFEIVESAKIEKSRSNYRLPWMDRWIKKKKKGGKEEKKLVFLARGKRELIWKPRRAGNNRHQPPVLFPNVLFPNVDSNSSEFERCSASFYEFPREQLGRPEFRNDDRLFLNAAEFSVHVTNRFFFFLPLWNFFRGKRSINGLPVEICGENNDFRR